MRYGDVAWEFVGDRFSSGIPIVFFLQGVTIKDISLMCTEEGIIGLCLDLKANMKLCGNFVTRVNDTLVFDVESGID